MTFSRIVAVLLALAMVAGAACNKKDVRRPHEESPDVVVVTTPPPAPTYTPSTLPPPPTPVYVPSAPPPAPTPVYVPSTPPPAPTPVYVPSAPPPAPTPVYVPSTPPPAPTPVYVPEAAAPADVLMRGPMHEAFAELVSLNPEPGMVISSPPPAPITELPPDTRPADPNAAWIPGYWAFDDDRAGFIWISGVWRDPPPGCSWVPGYWGRTTAGWQWTSGFWLPGGEAMAYYPAPPPTQEAGPIGRAPSDNVLWVSGSWAWQGGRYAWQQGYWAAAQADWIWMPRHFVWTPRGCVLIEGHWDYPLARRGILFAPVAFATPVYARAGFVYSPTVIIQTDELSLGLFARPQYCHYYFGDYYDAVYVRAGIFPWYAYHDRHGWDDPIYQHEQWQHRRDDPQWDAHERQAFAQRAANPAARPPRTYAALQAEVKAHPEKGRQSGLMARPLTEAAADRTSPMKFEKMQPQAHAELSTHVATVHAYRDQRAAWEGPTAPVPGKAGAPVTTPPTKGGPAATTPPTKGGPAVIVPPTKGGPETVKPLESRKPILEPETVKIPQSPVRGRQMPTSMDAPRGEAPKAAGPRGDDPKMGPR